MNCLENAEVHTLIRMLSVLKLERSSPRPIENRCRPRADGVICLGLGVGFWWHGKRERK